MNNELFGRALTQYKQKDYQSALKGFTACLQDGNAPCAPGEIGLVYHRIGNCLVKLKNPTEAIQAYTQAIADGAYAQKGTVQCNLGMAYASLHDFDNAITHFEAAVADETYDASYKAYVGMGNALLKLGKSAEAGRAFREAALDEANPDPAKSLLNLGVCFMALGRPADAVTSYESALQFGMSPDTRNKLFASLGQAYVACNQMEQAVAAFENAIADKTYFLSDSASVDYQRAVGAVAQGSVSSEQTKVMDLVDISGLDVAADGAPIYDDYVGESQDPFYYDEGYDTQADYPGYVGAYEDDDRFFNATEEELEQLSKSLARQDRKRRNVGLKILVALIIIVVIAFAAVVVAYTQGYGYPTQQMVTEGLFADPEAAQSTVFADSLADATIDSLLDQVVQDGEVTVDGVNRSMNESTVYATATTSAGGEVTYQISMVRDMLSWRISNIELYNISQN